MNTVATDVSKLLGEIRIDPELNKGMIRIAASKSGVAGLANRLDSDNHFLSRALSMGHEILVATTIAQSANASYAFDGMLSGMGFSGSDRDLAAVGRIMVNKIMSAERIPDAEVSDGLLASRFNLILTAI